MDPNSGNPYMQGSNPFMNPQPPAVKGAPQAPDPMAPLDPAALGPSGTSETTKPRQMPGGSDPMGMPAPGGAPAMDPLGGEPTTDTNVPQPGMDARAKLVAIRREVRRDNPGLSIVAAHEIAVEAVALLVEAASPMGPVPQYSQQQQVLQPGQQRRPKQQTTRGLPQNDSGNPQDRRSVTNPAHPQHRVYFPNGIGGAKGDDPDHDGMWRSQYGGRNPLQDRANAAGYQGQYQHLYGLGDAVLQHATDKMQERKQRRGAP